MKNQHVKPAIYKVVLAVVTLAFATTVNATPVKLATDTGKMNKMSHQKMDKMQSSKMDHKKMDKMQSGNKMQSSKMSGSKMKKDTSKM